MTIANPQWWIFPTRNESTQSNFKLFNTKTKTDLDIKITNYRLKNNTKYKAYIWQSYVTVLILPPCLHPKLLPTSFCCILVSIFKSACSYCVGVCHMFSLWISNPFHVTIFGKSSTYPPTLIVFLEVGALKWVLERWGDISLHKYRKSLLTQMKIVLIKQSLHNLTFVHLT